MELSDVTSMVAKDVATAIWMAHGAVASTRRKRKVRAGTTQSAADTQQAGKVTGEDPDQREFKQHSGLTPAARRSQNSRQALAAACRYPYSEPRE
jgi:hypothetical protein